VAEFHHQNEAGAGARSGGAQQARIMLREATTSGLLGNATALIVTAHTAPEDVEGFDVIRYTVCDVADDAANAEEDQIVFAPTLVKRSPGPRIWVRGDLADAAVVVDLLKMCGMKPST